MSPATVLIHESQFPNRLRRQLVESFRQREIPQKFHYDSLKQTQKWLALHESLSPARSNPAVLAAYAQACETALSAVGGSATHVIALGCGGGRKETGLVEALCRCGKKVFYTPVDVSTPMVLVAQEAAVQLLGPGHCFPTVCDLAAVPDWEGLLPLHLVELPRLVTFFGMLPSLNPAEALPQLGLLLRAKEQLLLSANLAPGPNYPDAVARLLPQYDNPLTRDWLMTLLYDAGFEASDGQLLFGVEECPAGSGLLRVQAAFELERHRRIRIDDQTLDFLPQEQIRLFFSYRHTPELLRQLLRKHRLEITSEWAVPSGEEGVFIAQKQS
jgi:uncharacterized SAM-dependent methyltransferase